MEIVAICGSPRKRGNTATLVEALLEGARERGAKTTRFDPAAMSISDCDADGACLESAQAGCIQHDDMQRIYEALRRADAWVLATPIYFNHVTATLKRVIDRLYALFTLEGGWRVGIDRKARGAVIVVQADPGRETPEQVADYLAAILGEFVFGPVLRLAESSLGDPGDTAKRPDLLSRARDMGRDLAGG